MKARDDITWGEIDSLIANAEFDFGFDERPLVAGELGAGIFAPTEGEVEPIDDSILFEATDKPDWLLEAGF